MIKQLFYKWFGLEQDSCSTCEVLRLQLDESNRERRDLLKRLLDKDKPEPVVEKVEADFKPVTTTRFMPMSVRRQMMEAEDRKTAQILAQQKKEAATAINTAQNAESIEKLEKELGVAENG